MSSPSTCNCHPWTLRRLLFGGRWSVDQHICLCLCLFSYLFYHEGLSASCPLCHRLHKSYLYDVHGLIFILFFLSASQSSIPYQSFCPPQSFILSTQPPNLSVLPYLSSSHSLSAFQPISRPFPGLQIFPVAVSISPTTLTPVSIWTLQRA